ncbi:MAG TPA: hybrid sensor histidine kinase/response regulator, partial [Ktedonobacterales bacterium]|nr:hybrid sensor histidine kinase/response regulator [Ktedonobacterales bacterium]
TTEASPGDQVNILMVDDQLAKLLSYEAILADVGANLIKATSAREALEHLLKIEIAIVLMDVSMPEMDGFELAEMIRQHPRYQKTAIIFVSAVHLTELDRLKGYEVGAIDYIPVPVIPEILRAKVTVLADLYRKTRQLEELNHELERRVEERTAALEAAMAGEREARIAAEAATQARDEFLSVAAHELKTPLTGLRATAQIIARKIKKSDVEVPSWLSNGLRAVDEQSGRLARLIGQLLDVTRLDQSKLTPERPATDISALAEQLVTLFTARTTRHQIALTSEREVIADVDPESIEQVVSNLLDNALKYSPEGGHICVEVGRIDEGHIFIAVRDHGIGISPERRGSIFERFYQAHADDHRSGLGLGLYISQQIIAQHDGEIVAEFPPDDGTRFVVRLPVHATSTSRAARHQP